jgi:putative membrane protein
MLPGVGASQAGIIAARILGTRTREFLSSIGGINTSNILFTFVMFYVIGKTRSGAAWAVSQFAFSLSPYTMALLMFAALTVCFISVVLTLLVARLVLGGMRGIDYRKLSLGVMASLIIIVILFSQAIGLVAMATGTLIGVFSILSGVKRSHMMGYLLVPTILYFSGYAPFVMVTLAG